MIDPVKPFEAMRADLVARGLLATDFRLTDAGNRHAETLIAELDAAREDVICVYAPIRWNTRRGGHG